MQKENYLILFGCVLVCLLAGGIGGLFTYPSIQGWYAGLNKPSFTPPDWVFGPAWAILYILMGISAYLILKNGLGKKGVRNAMLVFSGQLILNFLWSVLFFGMHSPLFGLVGIIFLWFAIAATMFRFYGISKNAAYLLAPYIIWVSFAGILNYAVWTLN